MEVDEEFERKIDARLIISIFSIGIITFFGIITETAINISFPVLIQEFHVSTAVVQWVTTGNLLVFAIVIALSAFLKKNFRMKSLFLFSSIGFIIGCLLCIFGHDFTTVLIGRLIQGATTGISLPTMYNIVLEQAPYNKIGTMMGITTIIIAIGPALGPTFGGLVIQFYGWRAVFEIIVPIVIIALIGGSFCIRQSSTVERTPFDFIGFIEMAASFIFIITSVSFIGDLGLLSPIVLAGLIIGILLLYLFYRRSVNIEQAILHMEVFKTYKFLCFVIVLALIQIIVMSFGVTIPSLAQIGFLTGASLAGLLTVPGSLLGAIASPICGNLYDRIGPKIPMTFSSTMALIGVIIFAYYTFTNNLSIFAVILGFGFFGLGQGSLIGNTIAFGTRSLKLEMSSDGNAVMNTFQQLFGAIGSSVAGIIISAAQAANTDFQAGTITGAGHVFIMALILGILLFITLQVAFTMKGERDLTVDNEL